MSLEWHDETLCWHNESFRLCSGHEFRQQFGSKYICYAHKPPQPKSAMPLLVPFCWLLTVASEPVKGFRFLALRCTSLIQGWQCLVCSLWMKRCGWWAVCGNMSKINGSCCYTASQPAPGASTPERCGSLAFVWKQLQVVELKRTHFQVLFHVFQTGLFVDC